MNKRSQDMKFNVDSFYKTMLRSSNSKPFLIDLKYHPRIIYDWTDYKKPTHLIRLKFNTLTDEIGVKFNFCEDDFIVTNVFSKFNLDTNCNKKLVKLLNFNSNSPTMKLFKIYLQKRCFAHVFSEIFTLPSLSTIEKALNGTKKQIREIVGYFDRHQTTSFRVCCDMTHPYNKGCFLVVNNDINTLFPIISQRLDELLDIVVTKNNQQSLDL